MKFLKANTTINYQSRTDTYQGKQYIIAPIVAIVEGVHAGLSGAFYYPADQIAASAAAWNGVPLPVYHPMRNGEAVSANDPEIIKTQCVGIARNMHAENGKLVGEAWIDIEKAAEIAPNVLSAIQAGQPIEVSTGLYADDSGGPGEWNGEAYQAIAVNYRPDHIALLPGATGACSISDGCGIRANKNKKTANQKRGSMKNIFAILKKAASMLKTNDTSLDDIWSALSNFVNGLDTPEYISYIKDTYEGYFIYETARRDSMTGVQVASKLYKRSYAVDQVSNQVTILDDASEVREETNYIPVEPTTNANTNLTNNGKEIPKMDKKKEKIDALIACKCNRFEETDREFLNNLSEVQIDKLGISEEAQAKINAADEAAKKKTEEPPVGPKVNEPSKPAAKPQTMDEFIANAPEEFGEVLSEAVAERKAYKNELIASLTANKDCKFSKEELEAQPIANLKKIAAMASVALPEHNYSGQAGVVGNTPKRGAPIMPGVAVPTAATGK